MAEHLLGKITLAQEYDPTSTFDDSGVSDFTNASIVNATTNILLSNQMNITATATPFYPQLPVGYTVDFSYGTIFTIAIDIDVTTAGDSRRSVQLQLINSSNVVVGQGAITLLSSGANAINENIDSGGAEWTHLRLRCTYKGGTGPTFEYTDLVITNDAQSVFNAGDFIIVYWDDVAEDFIVQRQDNPTGTVTTITSGPNLGPLQFDQFADGGFYKYCDGTTLVLFSFSFDSPDFPYFGKQLLPGNNACSATALACDVRFISATITAATNEYSSDGQVQLTAYYTGYPSSDNQIRYTQFDPATDIRGQFANTNNSSGLFTGLKAGMHLFYAVDTYGCYNSITVVITAESENSYNPKYRLRYYDIHTEVQSTIDIEERAYGGDIIYVQGGDATPFKLTKEAGELNNKFDVIRKTFAEVILNSEEHFQYISLYSQDDKKFRVSFTHGSSSWKGYLVTSAYSESYAPSKNYPVKLTATDGLSSLGDYDFVDSSGNAFGGLMTVRQIILECVNKIGLRLNLLIGVNKYATGMSSGTTDDPLGQVYIDAEAFIDDNTPKKCDEVLEMVLKPFGAYITQKDSKWQVIECEAQTETYYYREYTYLNVSVTNGAINPIINIDRPYVNLENVLFAGGSHSLEVIPAYGKMAVISELVGKESIFPLSLDDWTVNIANGGVSQVVDDPENIAYKALQISGMLSGYTKVISPEFDVKTIADGVELSFKVKANFLTFASLDVDGLFIGSNVLNTIEPQVIPIDYSLRVTVSGVDYYYNKGLGWGKSAAWGTSNSNISINTAHPAAETFTTQTNLAIVAGGIIKVVRDSDPTNFYFRAVITSYNASTGVVVCDTFANIGTYTGVGPWTIYNDGPEYNLNRLYIDKYREFVEFNEKIDLPIQSAFATPTATVQLTLYFYGEDQVDATTSATVKALPSATYPAGYKVRANSAYELKPGTTAESDPTVLRPDDYNATTNAVIWEQITDFGGGNPLILTLKDVRVKFLPNKQNLRESTTVSFVNNDKYREVLDYELQICDMPTELQVGHEAYKNILRFSDGDPTYGWARRGVNESHLIQELLLKTLGNQYASPSWRISGDWLGPDITFTSIIKHTVKQLTYSITNPNLPGGAGWNQAGAGTTWTDGGTYYQAVFTGAGDSLIIRQDGTLVAGARIKIDFNLLRLSSLGTRVDRLMLVLYSGSSIIQTEVLLDKIEADTDSTATSWISVENNCDKIGFFIDNMTGSGSCTYRINTFNATGVPSVRYYYPNRIERQDRMNLYRAEFAQLTPLDRDNASDDVNGSGGFAGDSWSSGLSTGFGAGFGTGGFWG